jgi:Mrp family chromosome partitioning ATPase
MELAFVISALRRRFWLVTLFALLGALPGLLADPPASTVYRSEATLSVVAPTRLDSNVFSYDPDRYVLTQLAVLTSGSLAQQVVDQVNTQFPGDPLSVAALGALVEIEQEPETDIVRITTDAGDPAKAQAISQAYAELYMEGLATTVDDEAQRQGLEAQITALQEELATINDEIKAAMEGYLPRSGVSNAPATPPVESVAPDAAAQRQIILAKLLQLQTDLLDLQNQSRLRVNTEILANAQLPTDPVPAGGNFVLAGGLVAGAIIGLVAALLWARFSAKVLDEVSVGEILGAPVASELPHYRSIARDPLAAFQALPRSAVPTVDQLCVRAEALARIGEPLTVVVTGTMRSAGSTTVALAMAERFAAGGASVVLVDADVRDPRVTALFNATADGGVPSVISNDGAFVDQRGRSAFTRTMDPAVAVLGLGPNRGSAALRRDTVPNVLDACRRKAEIVVVDGGPVLDLASTIQFATLADAVVLAVPLSRQKADPLGDLGRQLEGVRSKLLPVVTSPSRRSVKGEVVGVDGAIATPGLTAATANGAARVPAAAGRGPVTSSSGYGAHGSTIPSSGPLPGAPGGSQPGAPGGPLPGAPGGPGPGGRPPGPGGGGGGPAGAGQTTDLRGVSAPPSDPTSGNRDITFQPDAGGAAKPPGT